MADAKPCLHCALVATIYAHFDAKGSRVDGHTLLDMPEVVSHLGQVLAEFFAGHDDRKERHRRLKELFRSIEDEIPRIRASGEGAFPKHIARH